MKKVLLIGGSGSIGKSFIKEFYNKYEFHNISRSENLQYELENEFPNIINHISSIEDICILDSIFKHIKPDIVIHLAAIKHIERAQKQPILTCKINIIGSLNIIQCCKKYNVPITIGISTDKACASESIYGTSKFIMEKCFIEANNKETKFAICRFANVACSSSSIIPKWIEMKNNNMSLKVTDKRMNRMMFSLSDSSKFIYKTIKECEKGRGGFIGVNTAMKSVNIYELAKSISNNIEIIGKRTSVEKFDEVLLNDEELPYTYVIDDEYTMIFEEKNKNKNTLKKSYGSHNAEKMTENDIKELVYGKMD